jgi:hypothetical protein
MQTQIIKMINDFEHGRLSRRQLIFRKRVVKSAGDL